MCVPPWWIASSVTAIFHGNLYEQDQCLLRHDVYPKWWTFYFINGKQNKAMGNLVCVWLILSALWPRAWWLIPRTYASDRSRPTSKLKGLDTFILVKNDWSGNETTQTQREKEEEQISSSVPGNGLLLVTGTRGGGSRKKRRRGGKWEGKKRKSDYVSPVGAILWDHHYSLK